ncbi:amidohydrolase family protein [Halobacillus sp. A1]|uniref:amidohydrolase family protein n=1 Tax=Halobacillus sp. A1 TaxID=2880262 RepID=UPI0020A6BCB4|nr:amidohydrolase family protein [Halobacillus sp. A1]MCP3029916.1 amidohydrolase family protein [Halobacillus sp. A1]
MNELILKNVRLPLYQEDALYQLTIKDGRYEHIVKQTEAAPLQAVPFTQAEGQLSLFQVIDVEGRLLFPSFVDIHTHLDKAFSLKAVPNPSGTLREAISNYSKKAHLFSSEEIERRVMKAALQSLSYGTTHIRTHVNFELDVSGDVALEHLHAVLRAREALKDHMSIQVVPMFSRIHQRTAEELRIIEAAIDLGVDGIGGAPHLDEDAEKAIEALTQLAIKHDKFIDLHVDENDDPSICTIQHLIEAAETNQLQGRVTAGHLCSLAGMDQLKAQRIMERMADVNIYAVTLPGANLFLQGRNDQGVVRRGITRVKELINEGVLIAAASDNVNDPFHPFGRGDMLQVGLLTAYTAHLAGEKDLTQVLKMITSIPGEVYGLTTHEIKEKAPAEFVIAEATDLHELFASLSPSRHVFSKGKWVSSRSSELNFQDAELHQFFKESNTYDRSEV